MKRQLLETEQKALEINLDDKVYGAFAEIGAGQEVARYFFQVGASSGTIAKTVSAYDKVVSDKIYGIQGTGRYVCESRVYKMLDHEYNLMQERLDTERPDTCFFAFADTVAAINFTKTIKGDGWLGLRFQLDPQGAPNDLVVHARMLDQDNKLQQQAIGILGVNLLYACYRYKHDPELMIESLLDGLRGRVSVDMVRLTGPDFENVDNRWLSLMLVKHQLTDVAIFNADGQSIHASEFLYKKHVMVVRGSFRPATLVNMDMIKSAFQQFRQDAKVESNKTYLLTEITMDNLCSEGELNEKDFLDRADLLCAMGQTVVISNCQKQNKLIDYLSEYKVQRLGLVIGIQELLKMLSNTFLENQEKSLLAAFGDLFTQKVTYYVYPALQEGSGEVLQCNDLPVPEEITFLYQHLLGSKQIRDIQGYKPEVLHIFSTQVLQMIQNDEDGWERMVPEKVADLIKEKCLFGFPYERMEFEY